MDTRVGTAPFSSVGSDEAHAHDDGHDHAHVGHSHTFESARALGGRNRRELLLVFGGGLAIMTTQVVGGLAANSLVLLADAAHYFTDLLGILLAIVAVSLAGRPASLRKSFGWHRAEVIAAFMNALALWGISAYFLWEAWHRIRSPPEVHGPIVAIVGGATLVANAFLAWRLHRASGHNLNMRAAYLHILSDVLGSAAALAAGLLVHFGGYHVADPLLTLFVTVLILVFTWRLTGQTLHILLEGTPEHLDPSEIEGALRGIDGVRDVHDLHVWSLTSGVESLSVHVVVDAEPAGEHGGVVRAVHRALSDRFHIRHATVQIEGPGECPSTPCPPHA
jgi:cobalt-zinc-cadmium efflux system protein